MNHTDADFEPSRKNWNSFWSLLMMQTQNAFNDKAVQFLLICSAAALLQAGVKSPLTENMEHLLALLIVTPFILLSPLAGWIGDRFAKSTIIRFSALFQIVVFALLLGAMLLRSIELAVLSFFLLAIQSAILSPSKIGVIKELVGKRKLGYASGMLEMFTILGILFGTIIMSKWYASRQESGMDPWEAFELPFYVLMACTPIAVIGAFLVEKTEPRGERPFQKRILVEHFGQVWSVLKRRKLRLCSLAFTYFWVFGGFLQLLSVQISKEASAAEGAGIIGADLANMMLAAGCGIALGSVAASMVSKRRIELGLVPLGGIIMVVTCVLMAVTEPLGFWFMTWMFVSGIGAAFFLVPVNAMLQDSPAEEERGNVIAASNLLNCLGGIFAAGLQLVLSKNGVSVSGQFLVLGGMTLLASAYATKLLPQEFMRFTMLMAVRIIYRIRIVDEEKIPKSGGVLLVPNHVSYIDAFILSAASPRPIRFLMFDTYFKKGWMLWFLELFNTVPISKTKAKEAIAAAADAVAAGDVVCIFPEGQLTRTGTVSEVKRGFEMIARKAKCPVLPVYMDGLWGSIFSFERGKYLHKRPYTLQYGVTVSFGDALEAKQATHTEVRNSLLRLGAEAMVLRDNVLHLNAVAGKSPVILDGDSEWSHSLGERFSKLERKERKRIVLNALQLADGPALTRGQVLGIHKETVSGDLRYVLMLALPILNKHKLVIIDEQTSVTELRRWSDQHHVDAWIGGSELWQKCDEAGVEQVRYDISDEPKLSENTYQWLIRDGLVVCASMADPNADTASKQFQPGSKEGSPGMLLAGFYAKESERECTIFNAVSDKPVSSFTGKKLDSEGFLVEAG